MYVYVLRSQINPARHYTGMTANVDERLKAHNAGGSPHTSKWRPWKLVVSMHFSEDEQAREFERYLKTGSGRAFCRRHF